MINVCCVFYGNKYTRDYVQKLYNMVQRHLTVPHKFYCFTDHINMFDHVYGDIIYKELPLKGYKGWWNKLQLFNTDIGLQGVNIYFDIDIVITKNIDCFATYGDNNSFCIINDFEREFNEYNSSIMKWNNDTASIIWKNYIEWQYHYNNFHNDQQVITDIIRDKDILKIYPDEWSFSYKWYSRENPRFHISEQTYEEDKNSKIAVFHGKPDPHESNQSWVINNWK